MSVLTTVMLEDACSWAQLLSKDVGQAACSSMLLSKVDAYLSVGNNVQAEEVILKLCQPCLVARNLTTQLVNLREISTHRTVNHKA